MNLSKHEIDDLEQWLGSHLGALISHGNYVRALLQAGQGSQAILKSAIAVVDSAPNAAPPLSTQQLDVWKSLLPLLAEHSLRAVRESGPHLKDNEPLTKEEAAEYLGFSVRKLERSMKKRQIPFETYGTGQTATVRFRREDLDEFRESRTVTARKANPGSKQ